MPIEISVPTSKSISNRVLVMGIFCNKSKNIKNILKCDDTKVMFEVYEKLGIQFEVLNETDESMDILVHPSNKATKADFFMDNSGTATRFLIPCLGLIEGKFRLDGCKRMRQRPICDLIDAMRDLGVQVKYLDQDGYLPLEIVSTGQMSGTAKIKCDLSSQYLSGLLIAQAFSENEFEIQVKGEKIVSESYIALTNNVIGEFRAVDEFVVESDFSSASYFFALGALSNKEIYVKNINQDSLQPDKLLLKALEAMGAKVETKNNSIIVSCDNFLKPLKKYDCIDFPDAAMTLAMVCALTPGTSTLTGLSTLKHKECDRLKAIHTELAKVGVKTRFDDDSIKINGISADNLKSARIETYNDHRMAMCFAILQYFQPEIQILNKECVSKTFPKFWDTINLVSQG